MKKLIVTTMLFCSLVTNAHGFYCGKKIVHKGEHMFEVVADCGSPVIRRQKITCNSVTEEWLYIIKKYDINQLYKVIFNADGYVISIQWLGERK